MQDFPEANVSGVLLDPSPPRHLGQRRRQGHGAPKHHRQDVNLGLGSPKAWMPGSRSPRKKSKHPQSWAVYSLETALSTAPPWSPESPLAPLLFRKVTGQKPCQRARR